MSTPEWIQQAESWCASVEQSAAGVMFIGGVVTVGNALVYRGVWKRAKEWRRTKTFGLGSAAYWLLLSPLLIMGITGHAGAHWIHGNLPTWLAVTCMAFQFATWVYGGMLMLTALAKFGTRAVLPASDEPEPSRRQFIQKSTIAMPAVIIATAGAGGVASQLPPVIRRVKLPVRYSQLRGLSIAQFSDVHIGSYLERDRLEEITTAINSQRPDMVVCTGDLIDNQLEQLEHAQRMLKQLRSPLGTYMCMGNHEYIAAQGDECLVKQAYGEAGATVLVDEAHKIAVGGSHLWLAGTDFPGAPGSPLGDRPSTAASLDSALADMRDDGAPRIVLSHHPKTFFEGRERQIDLMLSGHTHGGQISLGRIDDFELTPNLPFEFYHKGLYEHDGRKLYVNSGIGSWLPVRINCPPEISIIEFV